MSNQAKVCVIGSNSFSGSDFIDLLLEEETFRVLGLSRSKKKGKLFLPTRHFLSNNYQFQQIDLNHDIPKLSQILDDFQPDYIVNFAAQSEVAPSWKYPCQWYQTNVVAVTKLVDMLKDKPYLKRYLHISSPEVYGTCSGIIKEDACFNPSTPYAASKAGGDLSLQTYYKNFGFPLVTVRATNVYGAHQQLFKIIPRAAIYLKSNRIIELHGGGKAVKSYIHIRDVSRGELAIMKHGKIGEVYHLSPGRGYAVREIVENICFLLGKDFNSSTCSVKERLGQDSSYVIDSSKARTSFGWSPSISIEDGLRDVVDWVNKNWKLISQEPLHYVHKF